MTFSSAVKAGIRWWCWKTKPMRWPRRLGQAGVVELAGVFAVDVQMAAGRAVEQADQVEQGAFAGAGRADQGGELAARVASGRCRAGSRSPPRLCRRTCGCRPGAGRGRWIRPWIQPRIATTGSSCGRTAGRQQGGEDADQAARRRAAKATRPGSTPMTNIGVPSGLRASSSPQHQEAPGQRRAEQRAEKADDAALQQEDAPHLRGVAPIARRMPISLPRWTTETTSTLAMPKATESAMKKRMTLLDTRCEVRRGDELGVGLDPANRRSARFRRRCGEPGVRPGRGHAAPGRCSTRRRPGRAGFAPCAGRHRRCGH